MEKLKPILTMDEFIQYAIDLIENRIEGAGSALLPGTSVSLDCILPPDYIDDCFYKNINTLDLEKEVAVRAGQEIANRGYEVSVIKSERLYPIPGWHSSGEACWHEHPCIGIKISKPVIKLEAENNDGED